MIPSFYCNSTGIYGSLYGHFSTFASTTLRLSTLSLCKRLHIWYSLAMQTIFKFILIVLFLSAAVFGGRLAYQWITGDNSWHLIKLTHNQPPAYMKDGYKDDVSCVFAGQHYLEADTEHVNSYQCVRHCNSDHSICTDVEDSRSTQTEQDVTSGYLDFLNLR